MFYKDELLKAAARVGFEVEVVGVSSSGEVADAALALCGRNLDAICQISDNLTGASFASIALKLLHSFHDRLTSTDAGWLSHIAGERD